MTLQNNIKQYFYQLKRNQTPSFLEGYLHRAVKTSEQKERRIVSQKNWDTCRSETGKALERKSQVCCLQLKLLNKDGKDFRLLAGQLSLLRKEMKNNKPIETGGLLTDQLKLLNNGSRLAELRNGEKLPLPGSSGTMLSLTIS